MLLPIGLILLEVLSLPVALALPSAIQVPLVALSKPSTDNEGSGWIDPRLNGGQFLDVCTISSL